MSSGETSVISKCSVETKKKLQIMAEESSLTLSAYLRLLYEQHIRTPLKIELINHQAKRGK